MESSKNFAKRSALSIGMAIALTAASTATVHAALPSLEQHLASVSGTVAGQYVGNEPYRVLNAAEFARMKEYVRQQYVGAQSVHVYAYDEDLTVDCINKYTQLAAIRHGLGAGNWRSAPTALPRFTSETRPTTEPPTRDPGVFLTRTDRDAHGNLRGCAKGSVPVNRLTLDMIAIFPTLEGYHRRRPLPSVNGHEYAKAALGYYNAGGEAYIYSVNPYVELDSEASMMQLWVVGGSGSSLETIEAGWFKNPDGYTWGKDYPHLFFFASKGNYSSYQWDNGSWFVQTDHSVNLGGKLTLSSVPGGSQHSSKFFIFKDGASVTGDWWVYYNGVWVGYYPYTEFTSAGLRYDAYTFDLGGEIVNDEPYGRHTKTDMGSGYQPSYGFGYSAYMRAIRWVDTNNYYVIPGSIATSRDDLDCYDVARHYNGGPGWETYIYLGGEGYNSQTCP